MNTETDRPLQSKETDMPPRPGRILTDTIYGAWCDLCDDHLGDFENYQEASISLTLHLDDEHEGWGSQSTESHSNTGSGQTKKEVLTASEHSD